MERTQYSMLTYYELTGPEQAKAVSVWRKACIDEYRDRFPVIGKYRKAWENARGRSYRVAVEGEVVCMPAKTIWDAGHGPWINDPLAWREVVLAHPVLAERFQQMAQMRAEAALYPRQRYRDKASEIMTGIAADPGAAVGIFQPTERILVKAYDRLRADWFGPLRWDGDQWVSPRGVGPKADIDRAMAASERDDVDPIRSD